MTLEKRARARHGRFAKNQNLRTRRNKRPVDKGGREAEIPHKGARAPTEIP